MTTRPRYLAFTSKTTLVLTTGNINMCAIFRGYWDLGFGILVPLWMLLVVVDSLQLASLSHPQAQLCEADNSCIDLGVPVFKIKLKVYNS